MRGVAAIIRFDAPFFLLEKLIEALGSAQTGGLHRRGPINPGIIPARSCFFAGFTAGGPQSKRGK
jgi:hypothetical protein